MMTIASVLDGGKGIIGINMASTGAVTQLGHGIPDGRRCFRFLMRIGSIIPSMASGTIRLVLGVAPGNGLTVSGMTADTG